MLRNIKAILKGKKDCKTKYFEIYKDTIIDDKIVLLEAGQGKNLNGNMFAIAREIMTNKKWENLDVYFVITKGNLEAAQERFKFYKFNKIKFVIRNTDEYINLLATAKYLITDNSFPIYFIKKEEQVYLNTWHGTPLKYLGRSDLYNSISIGNIQKNFLSADYMLFPNNFTRDVFMKDYMLENIADNKVLLCDYPRNEVFLNKDLGIKLKKYLDLEGKELIAYMPTWRGTGRTANSKKQVQIIIEYFKEIDSKLKENQILYVNMHFLVTSSIDFSMFENIKPFPKEYETYDFLNCCDTLITDYSSVFFDYAITQKKIILFTYDEEEYLEQKGMYLPLKDIPFSKVKTVDELIQAINSKEIINIDEFNDTYNNYIHKNVTEKILDILINKNCSDLIIETPFKNNKKNVLIHCGNLKNKVVNTKTLELIENINDGEKNIIVSFEDGLNKNKCDFLKQLPQNINYISLVKATCFDVFWKESKIDLFEKNKEAIDLEKKNILCNIKLDEIIQTSLRRKKLAYVFGSYNSKKTVYYFPDVIERFQYNSTKTRAIKEFEKEKFDNINEVTIEELLKDENLNLTNETIYNRCIEMKNIKSVFYNSKNKMHILTILQ